MKELFNYLKCVISTKYNKVSSAKCNWYKYLLKKKIKTYEKSINKIR